MTVLRRLSVLLLALCCCACSTGDAADVPQATPIPTPQVLEGLRRNEEGIPLLDVYLHEEETIRSMDIERYVCGVLAGEMRNDWPLEALKAQAILARTFVLKFVSEKESRYEGADISTDITEAQAYNAAEINERIEQAVAETCGQVLLTASGELPYAWFHAHSGGKTALAREGLGWNDPEPTYTRVTDGLDSPEAPAEAAAWNAVFPVKQFLRACRATGADTETAEEVAIGEKGRKRTGRYPAGRRRVRTRSGASPGPEQHGHAFHPAHRAEQRRRLCAHGGSRLWPWRGDAAMGRLRLGRRRHGRGGNCRFLF